MKAFIVLALATLALADNIPARYNTYDYPDTDPVYNFNYNVYNTGDGYTYDHQNFRQNEDRNGYETHGEYAVELPDGRTQIVTYQVNGDSGFIADVRYEGEAKAYDYKPRPAYKPAAYAPRPVYNKPAPAYVARPVYKPTPTYAPKPAPTYAPKPAPTYAPKPAPTYAPRPAPTYAPKREYGPVRFNPFG